MHFLDFVWPKVTRNSIEITWNMEISFLDRNLTFWSAYPGWNDEKNIPKIQDISIYIASIS